MRNPLLLAAILAVPLLAAGCGLVLGLGDFTEGSTTTTTSSTSSGGGGAGGAGGTGGSVSGPCSDGERDGAESDVDCGGTCAPCDDTKACNNGKDCASKICIGGTCHAAACDDKVQNGSETDVDCGGGGGKCAACPDGDKCAVGTDCKSAVCDKGLCQKNLVYGLRFGDTDNQEGGPAALDKDGNALIAGRFLGTLDFNGPSALTTISADPARDIFITKLDPAGKALWAKGFGNNTRIWALGLGVDTAGDVLVSGKLNGTLDFGDGAHTGSDAGYVLKLDSGGNTAWSRAFGDGVVYVHSAVDGPGNTVVAGSFAGTLDFGGGPLTNVGTYDLFVAKLDAMGKAAWSKRFGGQVAHARGVGVDGSGNILVAGDFLGMVDFGSGVAINSADQATHIFVVKLDPSGKALWAKDFGGNVAGTSVSGLAIDGVGDVVVAGSFYGGINFGLGPLTAAGSALFVAKLDPAGKTLWAKAFGNDTASVDATAIAVDGAGKIFLVGRAGGPVDFGGGPLPHMGQSDIVAAKLDASGAHLWSRIFGDGVQAGDEVLPQTATGCALGPSGVALVTGNFHGVVDLGGGPLNSTGNLGDVFVAQLITP